jgi:hypothetical protein
MGKNAFFRFNHVAIIIDEKKIINWHRQNVQKTKI